MYLEDIVDQYKVAAARIQFEFDRTLAISGKPASEMSRCGQGVGQSDDIKVVTVGRKG